MSHKKPEPIGPSKQPNICPVCGKASYSAAGVHPQCSAKKADQERAEKLKEQAKAPGAEQIYDTGPRRAVQPERSGDNLGVIVGLVVIIAAAGAGAAFYFGLF